MIGFSAEEEREKRLAAKAYADKMAQADAGFDVSETLEMLDKAQDSKGMSVVLQKPVYKRIVTLLGEGKIGAADLIKLAGMIADRVDGKVSDRVEVTMTMRDEAISAVRELVLAGVLTEDAGRKELAGLGVIDYIDAEVIDD